VCCPVARYCLAHAHCPVLAVPPPRPGPARRPRPARLGIPPPPARPRPSQPAQPDAVTPTHQTASPAQAGAACASPGPGQPGRTRWQRPVRGTLARYRTPQLRPTTSPVPGANHAPRQRRQTPPELICIRRPSRPT
jgi:hypothetical protein